MEAASKDTAGVCVEQASGQLLATSSALSPASKEASSPPRARQIFTVRSLKDKEVQMLTYSSSVVSVKSSLVQD